MGTAFWSPIVSIKEVIAHPERVKPRLFRGYGDRAQLRPTHHALNLGKLDADSKRLSTHSVASRNEGAADIRIRAAGRWLIDATP
jgi:hypothetical protein